MGHEAEIEILFKTIGAAKAVEDLKAVEQGEKAVIDQSKVNINDTSRSRGLSAEESAAASAENQRQRNERTAGSSYGLAVNPRQQASEEVAARKAATAAARELEQAEQDLLDLKIKQEQEEQQLKDVIEAKARVAQKAADEEKRAIAAQNEGMKNLRLATKLYAVERAVQGVMHTSSEMEKELRGHNEAAAVSFGQISEKAEQVSGVIQGAIGGAALAGPYGAAAGAFAGAFLQPMKKMLGELQEAWRDEGDAIKLPKEQLDGLNKSRQAYVEKQIKAKVDGETTAFSHQADALARVNKIEQARAGLNETRAKNSGASSGDQAVLALSAERDQMQRDVQAKLLELETLKVEMNAAVARIKNEGPGTDPNTSAENAAALAKLEDQVQKSYLDLGALKESLVLKFQDHSEQKLKELSDEQEKILTDYGKNLIAQLDQQVASGKPLDTTAKMVYDNVKQLLADGTVQLKESNALMQSANSLRLSTSDAFGSIDSTIGNIMANTAAIVQAFKSRDAEIAQMKTQIEAINLRQ